MTFESLGLGPEVLRAVGEARAVVAQLGDFVAVGDVIAVGAPLKPATVTS